jgi:ribosomal protein S11
LGLTLEDRYIKKNLRVNRKGKSFISGQGVFDSSSYLKNRGFLNLRDFNLRFSKSIFSKSARTRPLLESRFLRSGCSSYKRRDFAPFLQGRRPTHSSLRESDFELVQSPYFDEVEYSGKSSTTDKFNRLLLLPGLRPSSSLEDKNISEAGFLSMTFCNGLESQPFDVLSFIFRERYGLSLSKSVSGAGEKALIDEKRMQYSSLRYQGSLTYRYFPDANKIVRPGVPNNDFYGCYRPLLLLLRFFPTVTITFRANNVFFVLSSVEGKVVVSHSVGCGGEFTKSKRRAVFAYDAASREFAKKVRSITSVVGIRVYGQSKRRFYVLRNIKQEGIRFVFLHDIVPFACNGVKKSRPARKRR